MLIQFYFDAVNYDGIVFMEMKMEMLKAFFAGWRNENLKMVCELVKSQCESYKNNSADSEILIFNYYSLSELKMILRFKQWIDLEERQSELYIRCLNFDCTGIKWVSQYMIGKIAFGQKNTGQVTLKITHHADY